MKLSPVQVWRMNEGRKRYLGKRGKVVTYSVVRVGPEGLEKRIPYVVAIVEVGKERVVAQLTDVNERELKIGKKVRGALRRLLDVSKEGVLVYGVKFKPI